MLAILGGLSLIPALRVWGRRLWPEPLLLLGVLGWYLAGPTPVVLVLLLAWLGARLTTLALVLRFLLARRHATPASASTSSGSGS